MGENAGDIFANSRARQKPVYYNRTVCLENDTKTEVHPANDLAATISAFGNDVFCIVDETFRCLYLSGNWQIISGIPVHESIGYHLRELVFPEHLPMIMGYLSLADNNASPLRFQIKHADDNWHWCEMQFTETGEVEETGEPYYKCLLRNVNELVHAQNSFERAKLEADIANRSRSEFLANMNHELRTPLNAIIGFAQMMENGVYGDIGHPKYSDYVGNIQTSGLTLLSKVNDLIEIANIDSGRMVLEEAGSDLIAIIRSAVELHAHRALSEQVTLRKHLPNQPLAAIVDRVRILQVLTNVISNAIKYNKAGGTVDITCEKRKDGGIAIIVDDSGSGISASHLKRILSAFSQDNSFFARTRDCVGLGLALSKEIVKLHQGRIEIESEPGEGTRVEILLPPERAVKAGKKLETANTYLVD